MGSLAFSFLGGELKRVDMNASRTGSSATVYFELPNLRRYQIPTFEPNDQEEPRRLDSFVSGFQLGKDS